MHRRGARHERRGFLFALPEQMGHVTAMARPRALPLALSATLLAPLVLATAVGASACASKEQQHKLSVGDPTPKLTATAHDGTTIDLSALDEPTVVYFYPKDGTPGCTKEACAFRDVWTEYQDAGVGVIGVSTDDLDSHREFAAEHELPFPLVADPELAWAKSFGVNARAGFVERVSFLLAPDGTIAKIYPGVDPGVHAREVLDDAADL